MEPHEGSGIWEGRNRSTDSKQKRARKTVWYQDGKKKGPKEWRKIPGWIPAALGLARNAAKASRKNPERRYITNISHKLFCFLKASRLDKDPFDGPSAERASFILFIWKIHKSWCSHWKIIWRNKAAQRVDKKNINSTSRHENTNQQGRTWVNS